MIYPDVDPKVWTKRYDIDITPNKCMKCGKLLYPEIPFAYKNWRGLVSKTHECGEQYDLIVLVNLKTRQNWIKIYNKLSED